MLSTSAAIFSLLLVVTGVAKVSRPHDVEKALTSLGLPRVPHAGSILGALEVVVGVGALFAPVLLLVQGLLYLGFAIWVGLALRADVPIASCGCLGRADTPPSLAHIVLNVIAVVVSVLAGIEGTGVSVELGLGGVAQMTVIGVGVYLSYVVLTDAAALVGARRR
jgi:hypothetical protein